MLVYGHALLLGYVFMSQSQHRDQDPQLLQSIVLIVLETIFTFILKYDRVVRLHTRALVERQLSLRVNTYLPNMTFYVRFTSKGVLFDRNATEAHDLEINTSVIDFVQIFLFSNQKSLRSLRIQGDQTAAEQLKDALIHFSAPKLLSDWKNWFSRLNNDEDTVTSSRRIAPLLKKIDYQRSQVNAMRVEVKQYKSQIRHLKSRQYWLNVLFLSIITVLSVVLIYIIWVN